MRNKIKFGYWFLILVVINIVLSLNVGAVDVMTAFNHYPYESTSEYYATTCGNQPFVHNGCFGVFTGGISGSSVTQLQNRGSNSPVAISQNFNYTSNYSYFVFDSLMTIPTVYDRDISVIIGNSSVDTTFEGLRFRIANIGSVVYPTILAIGGLGVYNKTLGSNTVQRPELVFSTIPQSNIFGKTIHFKIKYWRNTNMVNFTIQDAVTNNIIFTNYSDLNVYGARPLNDISVINFVDSGAGGVFYTYKISDTNLSVYSSVNGSTIITPSSVLSPDNVSINGSYVFRWNNFTSNDNTTVYYDLVIDNNILQTGITSNTTLLNTNLLNDGGHNWHVAGCSVGHVNCVNSTNSLTFSSNNTPYGVNMTDSDFVIGHGSVITYTSSSDPSNDVLHYNLYLFNSTWYNVTSSDNLTMVYDYSSFSDGILNQRVEVCDSFEHCFNSSTTPYVIDNTLPSINITYPVNEFDFTNGSVNGFCIDNNFKSIEFSDPLFIGVNQTPFSFEYNGSTSQLNFSVNISCIDYADNVFVLNKLFNFDVNSPLCIGTLDDVTVDYAGHYSWSVSCGDDLNLFLLNVTCSDKTGVNTYNFFIDNINATQYNFSDVSGSITSDNVCLFVASDSHTKNDITNEINRFNTYVSGTGVNIPDYSPIIEYVGVYGVNSVSLDFSKKDRVMYYYNFSGSGRRIFDFYVHSNADIVYVPDKFKAHFVIDRNIWIDFDLSNLNDTSFNYNVVRVNATVYAVSLNTTMTYLKFNSVGIVNTRVYTQNIYARASGYLSTVLSNGVCPESVQGSVILFTLLFFVAFLFVIGLMFNIPILLILSSFGVLTLSFSLIGCSTGYGVIMIGSGIIMLVFSIFRI